jgi:hypothetical protein
MRKATLADLRHGSNGLPRLRIVSELKESKERFPGFSAFTSRSSLLRGENLCLEGDLRTNLLAGCSPK